MNNFKNIFVYILLLLSLNNCTDHVDYEAIENYAITAEVYFQQESDYEAALVGTYDPLQWMFFNIQIGAIASDLSLCGGESASDYLGLQEINNMTHYPENDVLSNIWSWLYEGVNRANYMEENKSNIEFDGKESMYGEVYFLRAYYYFQLVKFFGDVPLFTQARLTAGDSGSLNRSAASIVYEQIELDLQNAISVLPNSQPEQGRVNKFTAQALLGKVLLYQDKFAESAQAFDQVIGVYSLVSDYGSQFLRFGENGSESIFEIQYTNQSNWYDWNCIQCSEGNYGIIMNGPRGWSGPEYAQGWSFNVPTEEFFNSFEDGDTRRDATILDIQEFANQTGSSYTEGYDHTGYFNNKYIPRAGESGGQIELNYLTNYRVIRYSDILLMAAEALNRGQIDDATALQYLNEVRERAFGSSDNNLNLSGSALTDAIWLERKHELGLEGHRFFDLVRTGQGSSTIPGFIAGKHEVFPIPQREIDISGLEQNPSY